jgi:hypothetical protein
MESIDKNDVDISKLFKWSMKYTIINEDGEQIKDVYLRIVGDADLNKSRVYALRKSAELRKKLYDETSDEYLAYIPDKDIAEKENLIELLLVEWTRTFSQEAVSNLKFTLPTEPRSDASLEKQEEYQRAVDEWPNEREKRIREYVIDKLDAKREELKTLDKDEIFKDFKKMTINRICETEMITCFHEMNLYAAVYDDPEFTTRSFRSIDDLKNSTNIIKSQLLGAYMSLEVDGENLKKLPDLML